jgi:hypothetical protein
VAIEEWELGANAQALIYLHFAIVETVIRKYCIAYFKCLLKFLKKSISCPRRYCKLDFELKGLTENVL